MNASKRCVAEQKKQSQDVAAVDAKKVSFFYLTLVAVSVVTRESKLFEIASKELYTDVMTPTLCCVVPNAGDC